jgi:hypothetical protein
MKKVNVFMDKNGNKCVRVNSTFGGSFSIQVNDLPLCRRLSAGSRYIPGDIPKELDEIAAYVAELGTSRQKSILSK